MYLNEKQKGSLWLGILLFVSVGLYPPWKELGSSTPEQFAPIWQAPQIQNRTVELDYGRLSIMWTMVAVITFGLLVSNQAKPDGTGSQRTDGARTAGAETEGEGTNGARTAGAGTEGARTNGARTDGARDSGGERQSVGAVQARARAAGAIESAGEEDEGAAEKDRLTLHFPDRSVGDLLIESEDDPDFLDWFAEAAGRVNVPEGRRLQLEMNKEHLCDLSFVASMGSKEARAAIYSIDMSGCRIDEESLKQLRLISELEELDLSETDISDKGVAQLKQLKTLRKLWLDGTKISADAAAELEELKSLTKLSLAETPLTGAHIKIIEEKLPQCEVIEDTGKS